MASVVRGLKIILIDDSEDIVSMMATLLGKLGANVTAAQSSQEALKILEQLIPDVIVSDLEMPGEDGIEFIHKVRIQPKLRHVPAIALTAHAREEDAERALESGYQLHLAKPVHTSELVNAIKRVMQPQ